MDAVDGFLGRIFPPSPFVVVVVCECCLNGDEIEKKIVPHSDGKELLTRHFHHKMMKQNKISGPVAFN